MKILSLALLALMMFVACKKDSKQGQINAPFYFEAVTAPGDTLRIREGISGLNSYGFGGGVFNLAGNYLEIQKTAFSGNGYKVNIQFLKIFSAKPDSVAIRDMFQTGNYPYGSSDIDSVLNGVEIILEEPAGKVWTSVPGQSGSFEITDHHPNDFDTFTPSITSGAFQCELRADDNSIITVSGTFKGRTVVLHN